MLELTKHKGVMKINNLLEGSPMNNVYKQLESIDKQYKLSNQIRETYNRLHNNQYSIENICNPVVNLLALL